MPNGDKVQILDYPKYQTVNPLTKLDSLANKKLTD